MRHAAARAGLLLLVACRSGNGDSGAQRVAADVPPTAAAHDVAVGERGPDASHNAPARPPTPSVPVRVHTLSGQPVSVEPLAVDALLTPGSRVALPSTGRLVLDVALATRFTLRGPGRCATDPEGTRRLYVRTGAFTLDVAPDTAARPIAFELATPCAVVSVARAAHVEGRIGATLHCRFSVVSGAVRVAVEGATPALAAEAGQTVACTPKSGCALVGEGAAEPSAEARASEVADPSVAATALIGLAIDEAEQRLRALLAADAQGLALARNRTRGEEGTRALTRRLAHGAVQVMHAREQLRTLLARYRAASMDVSSPWLEDARDARVRSLVGPLP